MIIDDAGNIRMTRGDSEGLTVNLIDSEGQPAVLEAGATATLTVRDRKTRALVFAAPGEVNGSTVTFAITASLTQTAEPGKHVYDVEIIQADGTVCTVVGGVTTGQLVWELVLDVTTHE